MSAITHFIKKGVRQAEVDEYLAKELSRAGYGGVDISKTPLGERITIHAARPGIVIGRRGKNIRMITDELVNRYGFENPQIEVKEVENPELNAKVMAFSLVSTIERGVHRRRAAYSVMRRVLNAGAKGCEIIIAGKLTSKRSRHEAYRMGLVAKSGEIGSEHVISATAIAVMKLGTIGVTVNIMPGDFILPDEISLLNVKLDEEIPVEVTETPLEEEAKKIEKPKKELEAEKEKAPKEEKPKKEVKEEKEISKKKTDLDLEVEELSELIEKTPGEEAKPKKAPVKKEEAPIKKPETKKPSPATKEEKPAKKEEKPAEKQKDDKKDSKPAKDDKKDTKVTKDDKKDTKAAKDDKKDAKPAKDDKKEVKTDTKKEQTEVKEKKTSAAKSADKSEKESSKKKDEKPKKEEEKPSKAKETKADSKDKAPKKEEAKDSKSKSKSDDKKKKE